VLISLQFVSLSNRLRVALIWEILSSRLLTWGSFSPPSFY
jgi:hypothetical protein